jgi:hypothetical protein
MKRFWVLRLILFLYDVARLIVIVGIMTQLGKLSLSDESYPYLVYASAQALFPIMTWFIYSDAEKYLVYLPLNIAGKSINILLSGIWAFSSASPILASMSFELFVCLGLTLIILFTDIINILGMVYVKKRCNNDVEIDSDFRNTIGGM